MPPPPAPTNGDAKVKRDPKAPKKPPTPFTLFSRAQRKEHKAEIEALLPPEATKLLKQRWKELNPNAKKPYEDQSRAAKERYDAFERSDEAHNGDVPPQPPLSDFSIADGAAAGAAGASATTGHGGRGDVDAAVSNALAGAKGPVASENISTPKRTPADVIKASGGKADESKKSDSEDDEEIDEHYCDVCKIEDGTPKNPIVICDKCDRGFHAKCHKVSDSPSGCNDGEVSVLQRVPSSLTQLLLACVFVALVLLMR